MTPTDSKFVGQICPAEQRCSLHNLLHSLISATHDVMELVEPKCGTCLGKMAGVDISAAGHQKTPCDPGCECQATKLAKFLCLTASHRAQDTFLSK